MIATLVKMSEDTKRVLILVFLIFILLFVIVGALYMLVKNVMKKQGSKADEMLANVVKAEYFGKEKQLVRFGIRKNSRVFYKEAVIPFLIFAGSWFAYLLFCLFSGRWGYNPFNKTDGFGTILFHFTKWPKNKFFGLKLISGFPSVTAKPHLVGAAWFSYLFVPVMLAGAIWFLLTTQSYIARSIRIRQIARGIFRKKLVPEEAPTKVEENNNSTL